MVLFGLLAIVDGLYFHDYKYKLANYKESILEHIIHTCRAVAFPIVVYCLFQNDFGGWMMMAGVFVGVNALSGAEPKSALMCGLRVIAGIDMVAYRMESMPPTFSLTHFIMYPLP